MLLCNKYVTMNNETHLTTKKSISKFLSFLIKILMGNTTRSFSGHENDSAKIIAISAEIISI